jgi:hypothetical protein
MYSPLEKVESCNFVMDVLFTKTRDMAAKKPEISQLFRCFILTIIRLAVYFPLKAETLVSEKGDIKIIT